MKQITGPKLFPWQSDVVKRIKECGPNSQKIFVVKSKRQCGKSFMAEMELLRHSIDVPQSESIYISLTYSNCSKVFKELVQFIENAPFVKHINNGSLEIEFVNGSKIIFKSAQSGENLRGLTVKRGGILILDECAYMKPDLFGIVFHYVNFYKCNILMISTPFIKEGPFYDYYVKGLSGDENVESFDLSAYDTSVVLPPERVEMYRQLLPEAQFISEVLGDFIDEMGGVFKMSNNIWYHPPKMILNPDEYDSVFLGLDFSLGNGGDYTALSGVDPSGRQVLLQYTNNKSPNDIVQWIANIILNIPKNKIKGLKVESNSIGSVYIAMLQKLLQNHITIEEFYTSNSSKRDIVEYLISRVNEESVKLMDDPEQKKHFGTYNMEITKSGAITYNSMYHDDCVIATALAMSYLKDMSGKYTLSF